jgi:hypothetical protein
MDIKKLHLKFKDQDSPSVEGQIRWLQKQGFSSNQIDMAIIKVYGELDHEIIPIKCRQEKWINGIKVDEIVTFKPGNIEIGAEWKTEPIKTGWDFDQYLLESAKQIRTRELADQAAHVQEIVKDLKKQWENKNKIPILKRAAKATYRFMGG